MSAAPLCVVGIGASAGGIEAFHRFFGRMPADSGLAFIVVLHLSASRKSMLHEILARWTSMSVTEVRDGDVIVANHIFVVPGGAVVRLNEDHLSLQLIKTDIPREFAAIDTFFDSLAAGLGENAIGIVLSGTGHDGSLGLKAIKACGGLTLAQGGDGAGPEYRGMPDSAVATGAVDLHVAVDEMPDLILAMLKTRASPQANKSLPPEDTDKIRLSICDVLRSSLGHDFSQYKSQSFMRRVQRRMQVVRLADFDEYIALLKKDRSETVSLFRDLLISVTSFFRDAAAFTALETEVIPKLFAGKDATSELRIWVPGCATGEEAYSLAILLREHMDALSVMPRVRIFASDIDEVAIGTARAGRYPATLLEGMSPKRISRFFMGESAGGYSVRQEIREMCTFSVHSLIRDPPFSRMDLISCRNLLIYLDNDLQDRVLPIFHYAMVAGGILILGASETIARHEQLFHPLDRSQRIFARLDVSSDVSNFYPMISREAGFSKGRETTGGNGPRTDWPGAIAVANRRVLERFASPFVVVNAAGEIAHFSSRTGRFLEPASGSPSNNLFDMARRGWSLELRAVLRQCVSNGRAVEQERSVVELDGETISRIRLIAEPLPDSQSDPLFMIVFMDVDVPQRSPAETHTAAAPETDATISQLEQDNHELRKQLQLMAEEHAMTVEELRSSNEELQSVNEELQSTNEELETSREEIQSVNEELNTVNAQLTTKVEQLDRSNGDLKNLFDSTNVATVFLDPFLVIRSFTPEIAKIYNLIPSDIGRPLTDIVSRLHYKAIREDVRAVLNSLQPTEQRVESADGSAHYLMRILPYRSPDSTIDGSLITFVDVTSIVQAEQHQRLLVDELNHRVKNMLTGVISLATNTIRRAKTLEGFKEVFLGRIHALSAAYTLLSRDGWMPIPLREILAEELKPFMSGDRANVTMSGPVILLPPRVALVLGMTAHELTTNAVKYGALSVAEGNVDVTWDVQDKETKQILTLRWAERNGPVVCPPERRGFGMTLIERGLTHEIGGEVAVDFLPDGVVATLRAPFAAQAG